MGSSKTEVTEINHSRSGQLSWSPAAAHIKGTFNGDHGCLLIARGKFPPWGTGPTLAAKDRINVAAVRTSGTSWARSHTNLKLRMRFAVPAVSSRKSRPESLEATLSVSSSSIANMVCNNGSCPED